jgi:hypothetical protein
MVSKLRYWIEKNRLQRNLQSGQAIDWHLVKKVWSLSPDIDDGFIGYEPHPRIEYQALQKALEDQTLSDEELFEQLTAPHPMIVGWSLLGLLYRLSPCLRNIPDSTYERKEQMTWRLGYTRNTSSLGNFAHAVHRQYLAEISSLPQPENSAP